MDKLDNSILKMLQDDFPLNERPYDILAQRLQIPCDMLWDRVQKMRESGLIRRVGASLDSRKFGFSSTLVAISVPQTRVEQAAKVISGFPEVTHSYLRKDVFNIWFTIIAADNARLGYILDQIRSILSLDDSKFLNLPANRLFKLDARFNPAT
ncbi:MAG: Lrp/AsnC family transcriptional regulator [Phycisphaerae bacterium]|nr:Lrp/AsnC family transcriptional regulator [Phycisphaerae bacterium]